MQNEEIWKYVDGYTEYQVSNTGKVKSLKFGKERILKVRNSSNGYLYVSLCGNGVVSQQRVHRLVANAFLPNPLNLPQVNHKDENTKNNCVFNLEWCTSEYNINYGTRTERCSKRVLQLDKYTCEVIRKWDSAMQIERELGFSNCNICNCCNGKRKSVYGYKWRYA